MTNYEKFKDRLNKFGACGIKWGVTNGEPVWCDYNLECNKCELHSEDSCCEKRLEWLDFEYKEPGIDWSKVPVDAKILVGNDGVDWQPRHFASYDGEYVYAFNAGCTSWSNEGYNSIAWLYAKLAEEENE